MSAIEIRGLCPIRGEIAVQGSKNAVLPMMAASVLNRGKTIIDNVPRIQDVFCMMGILEFLGCSCRLVKHRLEIDSGTLTGCSVPREKMEQMRSSIMLLGALLGRCGEAKVYYPGGCMIGKRPIDLHLMALRKLGAEISEGEGAADAKEAGRGAEDIEGAGEAPLRASAARLHGARIDFPIPSVGATENALFAAVAAEGRTVLTGCAREPEIGELCCFLNSCGACVRGGGSDVIVIEGGIPLHDTHVTVGGDRIVAGTYLLSAAAARGELLLTGMNTAGLQAVSEVLRSMGAQLCEEPELFCLSSSGRLRAASVRTGPYPGFPTDLQSVVMAVMCLAEGESSIEERIFENRFQTAAELRKLGAEITIDGGIARIRGRDFLKGGNVRARDLRGGAALTAAALRADGVTVIEDCEHILRGYEDICRDLGGIGADISYRP